MCTDDVALGNELSTVYKPNGFSLLYDRGCQCRLESVAPDVEAPVYVYVMDVRFTQSAVSACYSEMRLTKQRKVVGSVRSPRSKELGFLHSFSPVVNLTTPVDLNLFISKEALPEYIWLRFEGEQCINHLQQILKFGYRNIINKIVMLRFEGKE